MTGGLDPGDIVVTSWSPQLTDGVLLYAAREDAADVPADGEESEAE